MSEAPKPMTLFDALTELGNMYGSNAKAAAAHNMTPSQWERLRNGKQHPTQRTLINLGLKPKYIWFDYAKHPEAISSRRREALAHYANALDAEFGPPPVGGSFNRDGNRTG